MKIIRSLIYVIIIILTCFNFFINEHKLISKTNIDTTQSLFYNSYDFFQIEDLNFSKDLDYEDIISKFDIIGVSKNSMYLPYDSSIDGLYGTSSSCKVPFNNRNNECDFVTLDKNMVSDFKAIDNLDNKDFENGTITLLINRDEIESFKLYLENKYNGIDLNKVSFLSASQGYLDGENEVSSINVTPLLICLIVIMVIVEFTKSRNNYLVMAINGSSTFRIYLKRVFIKNIYDISFLLILYIISILIIYFKYKSYVITYDYITYSMITIVMITVLLFIISLMTFITLFYEKVESYFKNNQNYFRVACMFVLINTILTLYIVSTISFNPLIKAYKEEKVYQNNLKYEQYNSYSIPYGENFLLDAKMSNELNTLLEEKIYTFYDMNLDVLYVTKSYAKTFYNYQFDNGNYALNKKCITNEMVSYTKLKTKEYIYSNEVYNNYYECIIVLDNFEGIKDQILSNYYLVTFYDTTFTTENIPIQKLEAFTVVNQQHQSYNIYILYYSTVFFILIITNLMQMKLYLQLFSRYEYIRYIYDRNYIFMKNYILLKAVFNLILILIFIGKLSWIYMLTVSIFELGYYMLLKNYYSKRLASLGGLL